MSYGLGGLAEPIVPYNLGDVGQDPGEGFEIINIPDAEKASFRQLLLASALGILAGLAIAAIMRPTRE